MSEKSKLAILVGGGPAPGINSVISAATIRAESAGVEVVGVQEGFAWIMKGDTSHTQPLTIENVGRVHFRGGSLLGISRANPTKTPELLETTIQSLLSMGVDKLITIGGDGTACCALKVHRAAAGRLRVVHVPKTIDNDINLPPEIDTFGFQTARHVGVEIVKNLMTDAKTTPRWYFVTSMGRQAGHLALGIGKAASATLTLIPEEYPGTPKDKIPLRWVVDTLVCAIIKRLSMGRRDGVAVLAEGIIERIDPVELATPRDATYSEYGHARLGEVDFGEALRRAVKTRLQGFNIESTLATKDIGYELRCADPIPFDMEYCRDLGYCAAKFIIAGGDASLVSLQGGNFKPITLEHMLNPTTGRSFVRFVDLSSNRYRVAKRYMIRLRRDELKDDRKIATYASIAGMTSEEFREQFAYIVEHELPSVPLPGTPPSTPPGA